MTGAVDRSHFTHAAVISGHRCLVLGLPAARQCPVSLDGAGRKGKLLTLVAAKREERAGNSCHGAGAQCRSQGLLLGVPGLCPLAVLEWGLWLHRRGSRVTRTPPASWPGPQEGQSGGREPRENKPLSSWVGQFRSRLHL